ncbi:MAG TPA: tetratricopeptide repeat protein, partial [Candidatus Dormibacteraeota bacterium]|nr:tetratricopeptide repeat protein [Candidatus Dormibacteraeota bacterium]
PASPQPATGSFRAPLFYGPSIICFLIASAGKQSVLLLPAVMLLWDLIVERRFFDKGRRWQLLADKIPFGLITLFFGWMTWHAQPSTNQSASYFVLADTLLTDLWLLTGGGKYVVYRNAPNAAAVGSMGRILIILGALLAWVAPLVFIRFKRPLRMALGYWVLVQMVPPMLLSFVVPITDRYLFLPSVGICLLIADCLWGGGEAGDSLPRLLQRNWRFAVSLGIFVAIVGVWGFKTSSYIDEWRDPRSVWYGAHLKTQNSQVSQFLGEVYQNAGDRVNAFITSATPLDITNETAFAEAVSGDAAKVESLRGEWFGRVPTRTNSVVYRDQLWSFAWQQYRTSAAHRGTLSAPNLFMNRGRLLVSEGKYEQAIPEFQTALAFATNSSYEVVREESSVHALRAIAVAYWNMRKYKEALPFYVQAQAIQKRSGQRWVPTLDEELEKLKGLAR